jgi:hypothetical protein
MSWMDDRDLLIAETLAFVKQVGISKPETTQPLKMAPVEQINEILKAPPHNFKQLVFERIASIPPRDERADIASRLASFKATQLKFQREREQYGSAILKEALNAPSAAKLPE